MGSLHARNLGKTFPGVVALDGVDLLLTGGSVHALVGANGAGKSTLIKILTGYYAEYSGTITIDGALATIQQPADALRNGIEVVHQEVDTALVPTLNVAENLLIEQFADRHGPRVLNWRKLHRTAWRALDQIGLRLDLKRRVEQLSLHEKQLLLIARAVSRNVRYLILDEPTASLSEREVARLFEVIRELRAGGVGILYISHRLSEVRALAEETTVLRGGRRVAYFTGAVDPGQVIEAMLGAPAADAFPPRVEQPPGPVVLEARGLERRGTVHNVSLVVRRGEVLGIAGLVGAGKTELLRLLFGADQLDAGEVRVAGRAVRLRQPRDAVAQGIFMVPEERRTQGLFVDRSVRENITLPFLGAFAPFAWISRRRETAHSAAIMGRVRLQPPDPERLVATLSGGNQQKVVVGKWLGRTPQVMLFDEPTQGIDVQAKQEIYRLVQQIKHEAAVIYASSEIDEVLALADRTLVLRDGRIVAELPAGASRHTALAHATGAALVEEQRT
jgi:simple sugar transport system ATP-binding protein